MTDQVLEEQLDMGSAVPHCPPERIIICVDTFEDPTAQKYIIKEGLKPASSFNMIRRGTDWFFKTKLALNPDHQIALLFLSGSNVIMTPFENKAPALVRHLAQVQTDEPSDEPIDLTRVFIKIWERELHVEDNQNDEQPPLRLIFLYGRPGLCQLDTSVLSGTKNLLVDLIFLHKPYPSAKEKKRLEATLSELQKCTSENSIVGVSMTNSPDIYKYLAKMLAHPNVR